MRRVLIWINKNRSDFIGLVGLVVGILGLVTGYWFYRASLSVPSVSLLDVGSHTRLINMSAVGDLPIRLIRKDGSSVMKNVYLARLYLWNSGNVALERKMILSPLEIAANGVEILDFKSVIVGRPEITALTVKKRTDNSLNVDFNLLESTDGCTLNVLYAANQPTRFSMDGAILGVKSFVVSETIPAGDMVLKIAGQILKLVVGLGSVFGGFVLFGFMLSAAEKIIGKPKSIALRNVGKVVKWIILAGFACAVAYAIFNDAKSKVLSDPANFVPRYLISEASSNSDVRAKTDRP
jgi:hypothetical protein